MLINFLEIKKILESKNISIHGAFHIGAHNCEEMTFYNNALGLKKEDVVWIDAIDHKVQEAIQNGNLNVYNAVITDKDDEIVNFNISNNVESSSILEFGTHATEHPHVVFNSKISLKSITVDTFFERNNLDASKYNFWNIDIQGAELLALKGATQSIQYAEAIYLEVNEKELYKGCGLIQDIDALLSEYKFKRVITKILQHGWVDALYIKDNDE